MTQDARQDSMPCESPVNITNSSKYDNNFSDYNDTFELGVNLTYPSDWKVVDEKVTYFILSPLSAGQSSAVTFIMTAVGFGSKQLEEFVGIDVNEIKQYFPKFHLIESKRTTVADEPAYKLVFSYEKHQFTVNAVVIYTIRGYNMYIIYYEASPDNYCKYLHNIKEMIDSIKIHEQQAVGTIKPGIMIDASPIDLAINPLTNKLYVAASNSDKIYVIDGSTNNVTSDITVGAIPNAIAINSITNTIYVASLETDKIYVIDGSTNNVTSDITAGPFVGDIAIDNNEFGGSGSLVYVTNSGVDTVSVIDGATNMVKETINVGSTPFGIAVDPIINRVYVANRLDNTTSVIDYVTYANHTYRGSVVDNVPVGPSPTGVAVDSSTGRVYVTNFGNNTVSVIDGATNKTLGEITVHLFPTSLSINPNNNKIYTSYISNNTVSVIDASKDIENAKVVDMDIDSPSYDIAINPKTNIIYVSNHDSKTISVINGTNDKRIVGVTFNINPTNAGYIECNYSIISDNRHITYMIDSRPIDLECKAKSNPGFAFSSWSGNIAPSSNTPSTLSDYLFGSWFDSQTTFTVSKYGTLDANFVIPFQISIPWQFLAGIILGPIIGWSIPFIADLYIKRKQRKLTEYIRSELGKSYQDKEEYLKSLNDIRNKVQDIYVDGKITQSQFEIINKKITEYENKVGKT